MVEQLRPGRCNFTRGGKPAAKTVFQSARELAPPQHCDGPRTEQEESPAECRVCVAGVARPVQPPRYALFTCGFFRNAAALSCRMMRPVSST